MHVLIFWKIFFLILATLATLALISGHFRSLCSLFGTIIVLIHLSWQLARFFRRHSQRTFISPSNRAVLVTGCDSGFGNHVARELDKFGFKVYAGCLAPKGVGAQKLITECSSRLKVLHMDVTNSDQVSAAIEEIRKSGHQLWAVINNAGISYYALAEWGHDCDQLERLFAVNVFGLVRTTKLALPMLREAKGRVINLASVAGK